MDFNVQIAETFRANQGVVTEPMNFGNRLVLVHVPKKDGTERVTPLVALYRDGAWHVSGSAGGSPKHPAWVFSLRRAEAVRIEVPGDPIRTLNVSVRELDGAERDEIWTAVTEKMPGFADYQKSAGDRVIPVFRLTP
ncbi:MAG TPA: nitroreductase family deazaflavin-dependent oxidoreductase [Candidatus Ruania gallistercoris]|uniref:Nitroreductase family deazaflavin-dependent oxidoreductase n=1 Tax=Candidatus Ruania gallistercoris TaxID=2838746 RepID=A0A9D2EF60_9MICO|nr:nitroreductase family deazaflavin-dependent oxidoreductase [Candidatus Ruania gallistercoris]